MTGVDKNRLGGMWTVSNNYITSKEYNNLVELKYIATSTNGSKIKRLLLMFISLIKIRKELKCNDYDIVHIHMAEKGSVYRAMKIINIAYKHNVKIVVHMHAGPFIDWYDTLKNSKKLNIKKSFEKVNKFLVLGEYWKNTLIKLIPPEKMTVLYNGVDIPKKNYYNIESKNVIYMGVLKKEKGIYDLIDAIKLIDNQLDNNIIFKLYGIDLEGDIENRIHTLNLENRIYLMGWIDGDKKEKMLQDALISVLPSYFEALSMTVIEAMSYGIPVITTNISTMNEILNNKAQLVPPGDISSLSNLLMKLINSKNMLKNISKNEYQLCNEKFSLHSNIINTIRVYKEIINYEDKDK